MAKKERKRALALKIKEFQKKLEPGLKSFYFKLISLQVKREEFFSNGYKLLIKLLNKKSNLKKLKNFIQKKYFLIV